MEDNPFSGFKKTVFQLFVLNGLILADVQDSGNPGCGGQSFQIGLYGSLYAGLVSLLFSKVRSPARISCKFQGHTFYSMASVRGALRRTGQGGQPWAHGTMAQCLAPVLAARGLGAGALPRILHAATRTACAAAATRAAAPAAVLLPLAGGRGTARIAARGVSGLSPPTPWRAFSVTSARRASSPAPNVAPAVPEAATLVDALVPLADPGIYGWWPSSFAELGIVAVHEATGLPWWQCIAGITLGVRTLLLPLVVYQV